ncbi:MAG: tetratricopeptide repeat protein [Candidatus Latescibacterota bacterium]|nr:MAG: tetratricopeptide repeat protein [Candidatus Latescibacterota bacterium]
MKKPSGPGNHNLDDLFEKYRRAPDSYAFVPLADACRKIGRLEEALEICEQGVARHPNYASGYVVKGKCLYDQGDYETARQTFENVLGLDDNNLVALKFLGMIEADAGHFDVAQRYLERILAIDPENNEIKKILRDVEVDRQVLAEGEDAKTEDVVEEHDVKESDRGEGIEGEEVETRVVRDGSDEAGDESSLSGGGIETSEELASITLADIFASQGYSAKAAKIYKEVLKKQPDNEAVRQRLDDLSSGREQPGVVSDEDELTAAIDELVGDVGDEGTEADGTPSERSFEPEVLYSPVDSIEPDDGFESDFVTDPPDDTSDVTTVEEDTAPEEERTESAEPSGQADGDETKPPQMGSPRSKETTKEASQGSQPPQIDESDGLNHFARWLKQMQK